MNKPKGFTKDARIQWYFGHRRWINVPDDQLDALARQAVVIGDDLLAYEYFTEQHIRNSPVIQEQLKMTRWLDIAFKSLIAGVGLVIVAALSAGWMA